jgi:hypothetical protein
LGDREPTGEGVTSRGRQGREVHKLFGNSLTGGAYKIISLARRQSCGPRADKERSRCVSESPDTIPTRHEFGGFRTPQRQSRIGRNPKTGERVEVPAKRIAYFKPSKMLRELVNDANSPMPV